MMSVRGKIVLTILAVGINVAMFATWWQIPPPQPIVIISRDASLNSDMTCSDMTCSTDHPSNIRLMDFSIASKLSGEGAGIPVTITNHFGVEQMVYLTAYLEGCAPCPPEVTFTIHPKQVDNPRWPGWEAHLLCNPRWSHLAQPFPSMGSPGVYTARIEIAGVPVAEKEFTVR
jgi:hypothetical protein